MKRLETTFGLLIVLSVSALAATPIVWGLGLNAKPFAGVSLGLIVLTISTGAFYVITKGTK